jgi:hypothetical protein
MDCLMLVINVFDQGSFLSEKLDHNSLLGLARLMVKDVRTDFKWAKSMSEKTQSGASNMTDG